ncbi:MAG TPA: hypothetical protein VEU29_01905 [Actinomycetota bacterium]|nr:hypothetical protein [Actinomycetota bacterium]
MRYAFRDGRLDEGTVVDGLVGLGRHRFQGRIVRLLVGLRRFARRRGGGFGQLAVELAPFLLGPAELLDGGCQIQEMDRDDGGSGAEVGVADESVELPSRRRQLVVDLPEPFDLLGAVPLRL